MKLTKKLFITIMTMALLVVTFSASTFAWFTLGTESKIENVQINVMAGAGMEISLDGKEWVNNIRLNDNDSKNIHFAAVTTYDNGYAGTKFYDEKGNLITDQTVADLYKNDPDNQNVKVYFEKDFYVRLTKRDRDLDHATDEGVDFSYVALTNVTTNDETDYTADANKWIADVSFGGAAYTQQTTAFTAQTKYVFNPLNAVKMSFTANGADEASLLFGYESNGNGGVALNGIAKAYADAKGYELTPLVDQPATFYEDGDDIPEGKQVGDVKTEATYFDVPSYKNTIALASSDDALQVLVADDFKAYSQVFTGENAPLEADNFLYAKVTVRIWLDGWDADCINAILDKVTSISFQLTAYKKAN